MQSTVCTVLGFVLLLGSLSAQTTWWEEVSEAGQPNNLRVRLSPAQFRLIQADTLHLQSLLEMAPDEAEVPLSQGGQTFHLPTPAGGTEAFRIVSYPLLAPELAAEWPGIGTYYGQSKRDARTRVRLEWTYTGFHAMVWSPEGVWLIGPRYAGNRLYYQVFWKADFPPPSEPFHCETVPEEHDPLPSDQPAMAKNGDCQLRRYDLALACTGEYAQFHYADNGSTGDIVLVTASAMATTLNRINGIYAADLAITLQLVAGNNNLIYTNGATDPYTNNDGSTMLDENQSNVDLVIGFGNYDVGHVFSTGGGGIAQLRSPCGGGKARGVTGLGSPVDDPFDVDYVAHEMGHQFGANHTQNNNCNRSFPYSMEPGSASTIMGYAGICSPNVQTNSDPYYHGISLQEIASYMESGSGAGCALVINSSNTAPGITASPDYTLPAGTPIVLTGVASDPDSDPLTYCWEQYDPEVGSMPPSPTSTQGPMFRSLEPVSSPERYLPPLDDVLSGGSSTWEVLPTVSRDMSWNLTVRDFDGAYGCNVADEIELTLDASNGPFTVTDPSTGNTWSEGQSAQVQWDVAGTDQAPVSCSTVDILLTTNDGQTFTTLLASTPNDGYATVTVPSGVTSNARVLVRGVGHVFYNVSSQDFTIGSGSGGLNYTLTALNDDEADCAEATYRLATASFGGYSDGVSFMVSGVPAGATAGFSPMTILPGGITTLTVTDLDQAPTGSYTLTVTATSTLGNRTVDLMLEVINPTLSTPVLTPGPGAVEEDIKPILEVDPIPGANSYTLQLATDAAFNNLLVDQNGASNQHVYGTYLNPLTTYYWRAQATTECGATPWTSGAFTTGNCYVYTSSDVPVSIPVSASFMTVESDLVIGDQGTVTDLDLYQLQIQHQWVQDIRVQLRSPNNETVTLINQICGDQDDMNWSLDDEAALTGFPCPPTTQNFYPPPNNPLELFDDEDVQGTWSLLVTDLYPTADGGSLNNWSLKICADNFLSALPVSWLDFEAKAGAEAVRLSWSTASEENNQGFSIERRREDEPDFRAIGWVDAKPGDADAIRVYAYDDRDVLEGFTYYYRLRQRDWDGAHDYSEVRSARLPARSPAVVVFPQPVRDWAQLRVSGLEGRIDARLMGPDGRQLLTFTLPAEEAYSLRMSALPPGIYCLRLRQDDWTETVRLLRQ